MHLVLCRATVTPTKGTVGTVVTIIGINLAGATSVAFHGKAAAISTDTANKVTTAVPSGATTGTITATPAGATGAAGRAWRLRRRPPPHRPWRLR